MRSRLVLDTQPETPGYYWANTPGYSDHDIAGKPCHAVGKNGATACGLRRSQWTVDLFNNKCCERCLKALAALGIETTGGDR